MKKFLGFYISREDPEEEKQFAEEMKRVAELRLREANEKLSEANKARRDAMAMLKQQNDACHVVFNRLLDEYTVAQKRQKYPEKGPTDYMRGLKFAINVIEEINEEATK